MPVKFTNLPFSEAQEFLRQKVSLPTKTWRDIQDGMHSRAFVIAGAEKNELLSDIRGSLQKALDNGTTLADFRKDFDATVQKHGWNYNGSRGWRTAVIFNTNMRTAFSAGNEAQLQKTKATRPYARYIAGLSAEPRPEHLEWHNTILPIDHPWWDTHTPPNGWGCKCRKVSVSRRELERNEWKVSAKPPTAPSDRTGIDESFFYNPGRAAWGQTETKDLAKKFSKDEWEDIDSRTPEDFGRTKPPAVDSTRKTTGARARSGSELLTRFTEAVGSEGKIFTDPTGEMINVNRGIVDHIMENPKQRLDGRERFFPFIPEVIENPYEVWAGFARNKRTGQVAIRRRYVKRIKVDKKRNIGFIAEAVGNKWIDFDIFEGKSPVKKFRKGFLVWGRKESA